MSGGDSGERGLGTDFPGKGAQFLLRLLLPAGRRDEVVGDLRSCCRGAAAAQPFGGFGGRRRRRLHRCTRAVVPGRSVCTGNGGSSSWRS